MSSGKQKQPKGVVNTFRRTWDKEDFEDKAKEREEKVGSSVWRVATAAATAATAAWRL
jgi:hypothetical protein